MDDLDYNKKSNEIRQLSALPPDKLIDHLDDSQKSMSELAPNLLPHVHSTAVRALQFLNSKLPSAGNELPLDEDVKPSRAQKKTWLDYHHVINDPTSVLKYAKEGKLSRNHIEALNNVYPDIHQEIIQKINEQLGEAKIKGQRISHKSRAALSLLVGQPLGSTQTPAAMQAIINSNGSQQTSQNAPKKASGAELKQINKTNALYATPSQAKELGRKS